MYIYDLPNMVSHADLWHTSQPYFFAANCPLLEGDKRTAGIKYDSCHQLFVSECATFSLRSTNVQQCASLQLIIHGKNEIRIQALHN